MPTPGLQISVRTVDQVVSFYVLAYGQEPTPADVPFLQAALAHLRADDELFVALKSAAEQHIGRLLKFPADAEWRVDRVGGVRTS